MINIFKNNWKRLMRRKGFLITTILLVFASMCVANVMSKQSTPKLSIAWYGEVNEEILKDERVRIQVVEEPVTNSELIVGKYDAYVVVFSTGYKVESKSETLKINIENILQGETAVGEEEEVSRGYASMIVGFSTIFLMIQSSTLLQFYGEERDRKQICRIMSSPIEKWSYLFGHMIFSNLIMFMTCSVSFMVGVILFKPVLDISIPAFLIVFLLMSIFGSAMAVLANTYVKGKDNAMMVVSNVSIITSLFAGSVVTFQSGNNIYNTIRSFMPQNLFLDIAESMKNGILTSETLIGIGILLIVTLVIYMLAQVKLQKEVIN